MPDGMGGAGLGAAGGSLVAALAYAVDKLAGSGRAIRGFGYTLKELDEKIEKDLGDLRTLMERAVSLADKLYDWHNVADPDDPNGKMWYFSVALRKVMYAVDDRTTKLTSLLHDLVRRFDRYNETLERMITVSERLQGSVDALGVAIAGLDRRRQ